MKVDWHESAREEFADIHIRLPLTRQRLVAETVGRVERTLAATPFDVGEGRGEDHRVRTVPPLMVWYRVSDESVVITNVTKSQPGTDDGDDWYSVSEQPEE